MVGDDRNVFVLTADSLRADAFGEVLRGVTEAVGGVEFTNAVATSSGTGSSMPALAAGVLCDTLHEATGTLKLGESSDEDGLVTMAEALAASGYDCSLWSDNTIFGEARNYDRGFAAGETGTPSLERRVQSKIQSVGSDRLFNACRWVYFNLLAPVQSLTTENTYYGTARELHTSALEALEERNGRQMHWLHYMDTHHPFDPPAEYLAEREFHTDRSRTELSELSSKAIITNRGAGVTDEDVEDIRQAYLACCAYLRDELLAFIDELKRRDHFVPGRDVFVFTADHGEGFSPAEHGMLGHTPTPSFWDALVRVPLVISHPEWTPRTVGCQVSHLDVMPTVLAAAGASVPASAAGRVARSPEDLCREYAPLAAVGPERIYYGVRTDDWKLFADRISTDDSVELTGTNREHDYERVLLTAVDTDGDATDETVWFERALDERARPTEGPAREVWHDLAAVIERRAGTFVRERDGEAMTDDVKRQLRDLGYLDDLPSEPQ